MPYVIKFEYGSESKSEPESETKTETFIVDNLEINRMPKFAYYWDVIKDKKPKGIEFYEKWNLKDTNVDYFQVTFTAPNTKSLATFLVNWIKNPDTRTIYTPYLCFKHTTILNASINDNQINMSLIAKQPFLEEKSQDTKSDTSDTSNKSNKFDKNLALEANYRHTCPGFVKTFQFGNYLAISTYPYTSEKVPVSVIENQAYKVFNNDYWVVYEMPVSSEPKNVTIKIGNLKRYVYTNLPSLLTDVIVTPLQKNQYNYVFGVHPSCELAAYLKVEDLFTGETWYSDGSQGTITLAPGTYRLTPIVVIPDEQPTPIEGKSVTVHVPKQQIVLTFLTPLVIPISKPLQLRVSEPVILQFEGYKTVDLEQSDTYDIKFDYPGTFRCNVYSKRSNQFVSSFTVTIYDDTSTTKKQYSCYQIDDSMVPFESQVFVTDDTDYLVTTSGNIKLDGDIPGYFKTTVDVIFHDIPIANRPVFMSIDGPVVSVNIVFSGQSSETQNTDDSPEITQISSTLYRVLFKKPGLYKITLTLNDGTKLEKHVSVSPGFDKLLTYDAGSHKVTYHTHDFYAIVKSYSTLRLIEPNKKVTWTEYGFGYTPITLTLIKGAKVVNVQYQLNIYNPNALGIAAYGRRLQLLHIPNAEIDYVLWYIDGKYIGTGMTIEVPLYIRGGSHDVKAEIYSNRQTTYVEKTVTLPNIDANTIQFSNQVINPIRSTSLSVTNALVTIINDKPKVTYEYLDSPLNISLRDYLYLERYTYVGTTSDMVIENGSD